MPGSTAKGVKLLVNDFVAQKAGEWKKEGEELETTLKKLKGDFDPAVVKY